MDLCHRGLKKGQGSQRVNFLNFHRAMFSRFRYSYIIFVPNFQPCLPYGKRIWCFCPNGVLRGKTRVGKCASSQFVRSVFRAAVYRYYAPGCPLIPPPPPALSYSYSEQVKESSSWSLSLLLDDDEALELSTSTVGVAVSILFFLLSEPRLTMSRVFTSVEDFGTCFGLG